MLTKNLPLKTTYSTEYAKIIEWYHHSDTDHLKPIEICINPSPQSFETTTSNKLPSFDEALKKSFLRKACTLNNTP